MHREDRSSRAGPPFIERIAGARVLILGLKGDGLVGIEEDQVRIGPFLNRPFSGIAWVVVMRQSSSQFRLSLFSEGFPVT